VNINPFAMPVEVKTEDKENDSMQANRSGEKKKPQQMSLKDMFSKQNKRKAEDEAKGIVKKPKPVPKKRCKICKQLEDDNFINWYEGAPTGAEEEFIVLFKPHLMIESKDNEIDYRSDVALDQFEVYDDAGHIVPLNTGLLETGVELKFNGFVKPLLNLEGVGDPVKECLLLSWWYSGFDGGDGCIIGFSTENANYHLQNPTEKYKEFMQNVWEEGFLVKYLIEYLTGENDDDIDGEDEEEEGVYERFLNYLSQQKPPRSEVGELTSETVVRHAESLVSQLISYQDEADEDEKNLLKSNLVKKICEISGVEIKQVMKAKNIVMDKKPKVKKEKQEKKFVDATVTPLVRDVFENLFAEQMAAEDEASRKIRMKACGLCEGCQTEDCGECSHCKDMIKYGGTGKMKQKCKLRKCTNMEIKEEIMTEQEIKKEAKEKAKKKSAEVTTKEKDIDYKWIGEPTKIKSILYYEGVEVDGEIVNIGDNIMLEPENEGEEPYVGTVVYMSQKNKENPSVHVKWFARTRDTIIGDTGDKAQLFFLDTCDSVPLLSFTGKATVELLGVPDQEEWRNKGGDAVSDWTRKSESHFYCSLKYFVDLGRFEYPREDWTILPSSTGSCVKCELREREEDRLNPTVKSKNDNDIEIVEWDNGELKVGDTVYLAPSAVTKLKAKPNRFAKEHTVKKAVVDEETYPENYRKSNHVKGNNFKTPDPFVVARIVKFREDSLGEMKIKVGLFYRPENLNTKCKDKEASIFQLYWSEDTDTVPGSALQGRCYVRSCDEKSLASVTEWCEGGPDRWYFADTYLSGEKKIKDLEGESTEFGNNLEDNKDIPQYPNIKRKLACMDIFAGCGGLSQGLHDSGVADTRWAVEIFEPAAKAFAKNNEDATVFSDDCNLLLMNVMEGLSHNNKKQAYPKRGEVELLCGGPPCQGFSGMNRFNAGEYSKFKNSLIATYLSYAEYYRPRYFILENVKNFACFKKSMVMKSCLAALVKMGYQCAFGILQAGNFGVAQTRRRAILLAAAPGEVLPTYPDPEHVFSPQACHLSVEMDGIRFETQSRWKNAAPRRTTTVWDTMSDLPQIENGESRDVMKYSKPPQSHFQRNIRKGTKDLYDHVTKKMAPLIVKRFEFIPTEPGSDWRDLPNTVVELSDGSKTRKLVYLHNDKVHGKSSTGDFRGVCPCADGKKCDPKDKQTNTLVPWCLPHTGNRHNHWAGLYGRVEWDGFFSTTVTNPEPMGKQGRVLHPEQNRTVSVRECARSQGFPDAYKFYGSVLEKHRQIGNAVPPPMGRALGTAIGQAIVKAGKQN